MAAATDFIAGSCYTACTLDRMIVFVWTDMPTLDGVASMVDLVERVLARNSPPLGLLILIQPKAGHAVSAAVRERLQQLMREYAARLAAVAFVFEGSGFQATIVRSVITAMNMVSRPTYWVSVFSDRGDAARQLLAQMNESAPGARTDLLTVLDGLLRRSAA